MAPVAALIPAHNEAAAITATVASVRSQVDVVIVVCDNCTDDTEALALNAGASVFVTVGNTAKKAGALNQALDWLLQSWNGDVLIQDADSTISPNFVEVARERLQDTAVGAVGGIFYGEPRSLVEQFQANEYTRYAREIGRTGKVRVLTGTAALIRREAMMDLLGSRGFVYDPTALTEDNELTLALKTVGWRLESPVECHVTTELMPTWTRLRHQRIRWYRGAIENLLSYGLTRVTRPYWAQQTMLGLTTVALGLYLTLMTWTLATGSWTVQPFWLAVGSLFVIERVATVWRGGWRARLIALALLPEMCFDLFLQACFISAVWRVIRRREQVWIHGDETEGGDPCTTESARQRVEARARASQPRASAR